MEIHRRRKSAEQTPLMNSTVLDVHLTVCHGAAMDTQEHICLLHSRQDFLSVCVLL